jgi:hypothetical protein
MLSTLHDISRKGTAQTSQAFFLEQPHCWNNSSAFITTLNIDVGSSGLLNLVEKASTNGMNGLPCQTFT